MPSGSSDISLAVGDGARRMTYAELADVRGISAASAERLARRRRWARQAGNDGVVRVLVPLSEARKAARRRSIVRTRTSPRISGGMSAPDIRTYERALDLLREQLEHERQRGNLLQTALIEERRRVLDILAARVPWWRRWFR